MEQPHKRLFADLSEYHPANQLSNKLAKASVQTPPLRSIANHQKTTMAATTYDDDQSGSSSRSTQPGCQPQLPRKMSSVHRSVHGHPTIQFKDVLE